MLHEYYFECKQESEWKPGELEKQKKCFKKLKACKPNAKKKLLSN